MSSVPPDVSLLEGLATTRTIRRYTTDPIPSDDLNTILWHATRAPSGSNRQPVRFLVLSDGPRATAAKSVLGESFRRGWAAKVRSDGYDVGSGDVGFVERGSAQDGGCAVGVLVFPGPG